MPLFIFDADVIQLQLCHQPVTQKKRKNMKKSVKLFWKTVGLSQSVIGTFHHSCTLRAVSMTCVPQRGILNNFAKF